MATSIIIPSTRINVAIAPCIHDRNTGGFDMLGSGRDKIETKEQMEASKKVRADFWIRFFAFVRLYSYKYRTAGYLWL